MGAKASTGSRAHSDPAREPNTPFRPPVSHPLRLGPKAAKRIVALVIMAAGRVNLLVASSSGQRPAIAAARDRSGDHLRSFWVEGDGRDVRPVARGT